MSYNKYSSSIYNNGKTEFQKLRSFFAKLNYAIIKETKELKQKISHSGKEDDIDDVA